MSVVAVAQALALGLALVAVLATCLVLAREALTRLKTRVARARLDVALKALGAASSGSIAEVAASLRRDFDRLTVERVVESLLRDDASRARGAELFRELGLLERQTALLRDARAWADRTTAAQVLGRAGAVEAVPALVLALRDPYEDATVKGAAADALAKFRDPRAVPYLVRELRDLDEGASRPIAEALVRFGDAGVPDLLGLLADEGHPRGRVWAARILGHVGAADAVEPLVALLHARDDLLRIAAAASLGEIRDRRALQPLVQATLRDPAAQVRAQAAGAVASIEAEGAVDVLIAALGDPDYVTRLRALEAFENTQLKDPAPLVRALRDPRNEVRRRAALALERVGYLDRVVEEMASADAPTSRDAYFRFLELGRAGLTDGVVSFMNHASFQVRALAAKAAGDLGAASAARLVFAAIDDPDWPVRAAAAETIGRLRLEGGVARLVAHLADEDESVRDAAAEAIDAFPAPDVAPFCAGILDAYARGTVLMRLHLVGVAARIGGDVAVELLSRASTDPSDWVRVQAVQAMGAQRPAGRFMAQLIERVTDASLDVRTAAVAALGADVSPEAFEALVRALPGASASLRDRIAEALATGAREPFFRRVEELSKAADVDVRLGIAWTLGRIGEPAGVTHLVRLLKAQEAVVRASAAGALAKVEAPAAIDALLEACEDRDPRTRAAVVNALAKHGAGDARIAARVLARLKDPDAFVRNRAALALARVSGAEAERALADPAIEARVDLAARLVALTIAGGDSALGRALDLMLAPDALQRALAFLGHEDAALRPQFFARLRLPDPSAMPSSLSDPSAVPHYDTVLRTALDVEDRRVAVEALARVESALAIEVLADALVSDPVESIRQRTAQALAARVGDDRARAALVRAVDDPSPSVACVAIHALRETGDPRARAALFPLLGSSAPAVRDAAEASLAEMHRGDVMPLLDQIMGVDRPELLAGGIRVLARIPDPSALPLLEHLLRSQHEGVRAATLAVLAKLPPDPATDAAIDGALDDPNEDVRRSAIEAIAASADERAVQRLRRVRVDPSAALRVELARSLSATPEESSYKILRELVDDGAPAVRASALATLLQRGEARGMRVFLERWRKGVVDLRGERRAEAISARLAIVLEVSADEESRKAAVAGIAAMRAPAYEKRLLPALRDPSPGVRIDTIRALASSDDPDVRSRIAELLEDPIAEVREAARRAPLRLIG
jgi:HEAT repeat protein